MGLFVKPESTANAAVAAATDSPSPGSSSTASPLPYGPCSQNGPNNSQSSVCLYGMSSAQVFTGPNQLGPATYTLADVNLKHGCKGGAGFKQSWPATVAGAGTTGQYWNCSGRRVAVTGNYAPPAPLPSTDVVGLYADNHGNSGRSNGNPPWQPYTGTCVDALYTQCTVGYVQGDGGNNQSGQSVFAGQGAGQGGYTNFSYYITNFPVTVAITNNLPSANNDSLSLVGTAQTSQFVLDPNGGNPATVAAGDAGYFGMYGTNGSNQQLEGFSAVYQVSSSSTDLAGTSFNINAVINPKTGQLDPSASCTVNQGSSSQPSSYCTLTISGGLGSPQTVGVNIHE